MAVSAACPKCGAASPVPEEMVGKKVRCKKCQAVFVVESTDSKKKRPPSKPSHTPSGGTRRPAKKSNATTFAVLAVVTLLAVGGGGAAVWFAMQQPEPVKHAKAKTVKKEESHSDKKSPKAKDFTLSEFTKPAPQVDSPQASSAKKSPAVNLKPPVPGEVKAIEPTIIAALSASTLLDGVKDISAVKGIIPVGNKPHLVGLHTTEGAQHFFELYDLKKQERVAKVNVGADVVLLDVDPDGTALTTVFGEKYHFNVYTLPDGALIDDDWRPYDNIQDQMRFLSSGKVAQIAMLAGNRCWVMTSHGFGDLWEVRTHKLEYPISAPQRTEMRKPEVQPGRDFVLSPDRTQFAYATDEGIEFFDAKTGKPTGKSPKLSKYGTKAELVGMGFDPSGTKLAAYFSAGKGGGRPFFHARFSVPAGAELFVEEGPDPGSLGNVEFVDGDHFLAFDRDESILRDGKGKTVASGKIVGRGGMFSPKVVQAKVAFAFVDDKKRPALGLVPMPLSVAAPVATPPPAPTPAPSPPAGKGSSSLEDLFGGPSTPPVPAAKTAPGETARPRTFEHQELWDFGPNGIRKTAIKALER